MARSNIRKQVAVPAKMETKVAESGVEAHYNAMHWNRVRKIAVEKGIAVLGRKKHELVADLVALDQGA